MLASKAGDNMNNDNKMIFLGVLAVVVIGLLAVSGFFVPSERSVTVPRYNVNEYSYKVSAEKPEMVIANFAADETSGEKTATELTVYNQDLGLVKERRNLNLKSGLNLVKYEDVAKLMDPSSVLFRDLKDKSTFIAEQNYEFDTADTQKLLEKYVGKQITVNVQRGQASEEVKGTLLSAGGNVMLQTLEGVETLNSVESIVFPSLPEGLLSKPTLVWKVYAQSDGPRETETTYLTQGFNWKADYVAEVNENEDAMSLNGWATVTNNSGTSYPNATLKLVAGDVHRVTPPTPTPIYAYKGMAMEEAAPMAADRGGMGFERQALSEYHAYRLRETTNLLNNETKQISLLAAENVKVRKELVYDGQYNGEKVQVKLAFTNKTQQGLGMPMPQGIVRVYKRDSEDQMEFLGEDSIEHTPENLERKLFVGSAFDVTGERKQTNYEDLGKRNRQTYEITLKNAKDREAEVVILEHAWGEWKIIENSDAFEKKNVNEFEFKVKVPAKGEKKVTYTIEYSY